MAGVLLASGVLGAQELTPGVRVRVRVSEPYRQVELAPRLLELRGTLIRATPDSIALQVSESATPTVIARSAVRSLAVSRGEPSRLSTGARRMFAGAFSGALAGTAVYAADYRRREGESWGTTVGWWSGGWAAAGLLVGVLSPVEDWRRVPLRPAAAPSGDGGAGLALAVTLPF